MGRNRDRTLRCNARKGLITIVCTFGGWRDLQRLPKVVLRPSKTENFAHSGRETAQKRPRNGWRNGRVSAKVTASASPRGDQRSWGVALPSDKASRRSSPARDKGPPWPFPPTLYLIRCTIVYYFQTHYGQSPVLIRCTLAGFYSEKKPCLKPVRASPADLISLHPGRRPTCDLMLAVVPHILLCMPHHADIFSKG